MQEEVIHPAALILLCNAAVVLFALQGLDGLALPHQRLSLYAMGSDVLDFLGDGCLGDLDAFLAANSTEQQQQQQQFPGLPRISDALGEMAAPAGRPCGARFGGFGG